jgi:hypothetical protein
MLGITPCTPEHASVPGSSQTPLVYCDPILARRVDDTTVELPCGEEVMAPQSPSWQLQVKASIIKKSVDEKGYVELVPG